MANGQNLPDLVSALDKRLAALESDIQSARRDVEQARQNVRNLDGTQKRLVQETADINEQIRKLPPDQIAARTERESRARANETKLAEVKNQLTAAQSRLDALVAEKKEEASQRRLEQARADFLVEAKALLNARTDQVVRFFLGVAVLQACQARNINVAAFTSMADKEKVADILRELAEARDGASAETRQEASRLDELRRLSDELARARKTFLSETSQAQTREASLAHRRDEVQQDIGRLEEADKASEAARQNRESGFFARVKSLVTGVQDKFRNFRLNSKRAELKTIDQELEEIKIAGPKRIKEAEEKAAQYQENLAKLDTGPAVVAGPVDGTDPLAAVLQRARAMLDRWWQSHPEIEKVIARPAD